MEQQSPLDHFLSFLSALIDPDLRFHPLYILPFFAMAFLLYLYHRRRGLHDGQGFFKWLFPKDVYFHPSHITDIKLFLLGQVLTAAKAFNMIVVMTLFAGLTILAVGGEVSAKPLTVGRVLLVTIVITLIRDFCVYWVHRLHHELPVFWPFHAVHHSAEVMTPVTVYRKHPFYDLISSFVKNIFVGIFSGLALVFLVGQIQLTLIAGVNIFYFLFNALGSNFRHSHIWFSYGPFWEKIFISPAQHQIHHSLEPRHHNKNYGEIFAFWDWIFGTIYIPAGREDLQFGISKSSTSNERIAQPHPTLKSALLVPFRDSWKALKRRRKKK
jgi:sterol desaturase/sphingolipid hydroxylase (fatty acid hydroxylase superfamily)